MFDAEYEIGQIVTFIRDYMEHNGPHSPIIIGMSGGKDSTIVATLCAKAVGGNRVIGVSLPYGSTSTRFADDAIRAAGIKSITMNIGMAYNSMIAEMRKLKLRDLKEPNDVVKFNAPARMRMNFLYMIANQIGGRVANTCNLSESYIGYDTAWGDQVGDFAPIQNYTVTELRAIGDALGLPKYLVHKVPEDGLCGQPDEVRFGFTYEILDRYLRDPEHCNVAPETIDKIEAMHARSKFKYERVTLPNRAYFPGGKTLH